MAHALMSVFNALASADEKMRLSAADQLMSILAASQGSGMSRQLVLRPLARASKICFIIPFDHYDYIVFFLSVPHLH
jgi:hypothetical protein